MKRDVIPCNVQIRIVRGTEGDEDIRRDLTAQLFEVLAAMERFALSRVIRLVGDLDEGVGMLRRHCTYAANVRRKIDLERCSVGQSHDLHVKAVARGSRQKGIESGEAAFRRKLEQMFRHCQDTDDGELLVGGPGEIRVDIGGTSRGFHLEQPEGRDAAPVERTSVGLNEAGPAYLYQCELSVGTAAAREQGERDGNRDQAWCATGVSLWTLRFSCDAR